MMQWVLPVGFTIVGLLTGFISEILYQRLQKFAHSKELPGREIIFYSLRYVPFIWSVSAGFMAAVVTNEFTPQVSTILKNSITIFFLYSVTLILARLTASCIKIFVRRDARVSTSLIANIARIIIFTLGFLVILDTVGVKITPIVTTLGISGLAVGLALQNTLANLFSGFFLIISKKIRTGDYIKLETGQEGYVTDINWRDTTIKEISNNTVVIPNSKLSTSIFTNYHLPSKDISLAVNVAVGSDSNLETVEKITIEAAKEVMYEVSPKLTHYEPSIVYQHFGDLSINYTVYLRVNEFLEQRKAKHLLLRKLYVNFQQEGIPVKPNLPN